jgi:hypothetical protein
MPTLAPVERLAGDSVLDRGIGEWDLSYYSNNSDEVTKGKGVRRDKIRRAKQVAGRSKYDSNLADSDRDRGL